MTSRSGELRRAQHPERAPAPRRRRGGARHRAARPGREPFRFTRPPLRGPRPARPARPRRQGPHGLERADDRGPGRRAARDRRPPLPGRGHPRGGIPARPAWWDADGRLLRTSRAGKAHLAAYLEDYAYLAAGLLDLYEAGGDAAHLREAERLAGQILTDFAAEDGGFYSTASGHETLIVRHREGHDGATPAANAVAAHTLARLSYHLDRSDLRERAVEAIRAWGKAIARQPRAFTTTLAAADLLLEGPVELALVGEASERDALRAEVARHYLPNRIVALHDPAHGTSDLPLVAGKTTGGRAGRRSTSAATSPASGR
jgi:hypothetical protein